MYISIGTLYSVYMEYQEEANYVAQMNIYYMVFYSSMVLTGTYTTNSLMETVSVLDC